MEYLSSLLRQRFQTCLWIRCSGQLHEEHTRVQGKVLSIGGSWRKLHQTEGYMKKNLKIFVLLNYVFFSKLQWNDNIKNVGEEVEKSTYVLSNGWMDKENVVCIYTIES
jgi:hypothetical protein